MNPENTQLTWVGAEPVRPPEAARAEITREIK
jgi:hypothetical protein